MFTFVKISQSQAHYLRNIAIKISKFVYANKNIHYQEDEPCNESPFNVLTGYVVY